MSTFGSRHAKATSLFNIDSSAFEYVSLQDLVGMYDTDMQYVLHALYINNKGQYGPQALAVIDNYKVNLPSHLLSDVREMLANPEDVAAINDGRAGFVIYTYTPKNGKQLRYSVNWIDITPDK